MDRIRSFKYAISGIIHSYFQPNMQLHLIAAIMVILSGIILKLNFLEWTIIILCIGLVKAAEVFNTAIEKLVDLVSPEENEQAGLVKDLSAGAVLIFAIISAVVGSIIFIPKIIALIGLISKG